MSSVVTKSKGPRTWPDMAPAKSAPSSAPVANRRAASQTPAAETFSTVHRYVAASPGGIEAPLQIRAPNIPLSHPTTSEAAKLWEQVRQRTVVHGKRGVDALTRPASPVSSEARPQDRERTDQLQLARPATAGAPLAERDQARVMLIGLPVDLAAHLVALGHNVVVVEKADALGASPSVPYDVIVAEAGVWSALHVPQAFSSLLRASKDSAVLSISPREDPPGQLKYADGRPSGFRRSILQNLVYSQLLSFLWQQHASRRVFVPESQSMESETSFDAEARGEREALAHRVAELTAAKVTGEQSLAFLTSENNRLRTKLVAARAAAAEKTTKVIVVNAYQDLDVLASTVKNSPTPREASASVLSWLLTDSSYAAIHDLIRELLDQISELEGDAPDFEELVRTSGMDAVTQSWLLYQFSVVHGKPKGLRRTASGGPLKDEKPLPLAFVEDETVIDTWGFSAFDFNTEQLITLFMTMLDRLDLLRAVSCPRNNMIRFLRGVAKMYKDNPYHGFRHAVDVAQVAYKTVEGTGARKYLEDLDLFCLLVASVCHDVDHPGTSNAFQVADATTLAMIYNDRSPLENHHASCAFYIAAETGCDIFIGMQDATYAAVRQMIIKAILITDMTNHFDLQKQLSNTLPSYFSNKSLEARQFLVNTLIHLADLSNVCRPWNVSKAWSDRVCEEYFRQGDLEKSKGLPVSANMDRKTTKQDAMTLGFIDFIVMPMVSATVHLIGELQPLYDNLRANRSVWDAMHRASGAPSYTKPASPRRKASDAKPVDTDAPPAQAQPGSVVTRDEESPSAGDSKAPPTSAAQQVAAGSTSPAAVAPAAAVTAPQPAVQDEEVPPAPTPVSPASTPAATPAASEPAPPVAPAVADKAGPAAGPAAEGASAPNMSPPSGWRGTLPILSTSVELELDPDVRPMQRVRSRSAPVTPRAGYRSDSPTPLRRSIPPMAREAPAAFATSADSSDGVSVTTTWTSLPTATGSPLLSRKDDSPTRSQPINPWTHAVAVTESISQSPTTQRKQTLFQSVADPKPQTFRSEFFVKKNTKLPTLSKIT